MLMHIGQRMIIKPGPTTGFLIHLKADRMDQMQAGTCICAEPDDIAGVGRDLRVEQDDVKHQDAALFTASGAAVAKAGNAWQASSIATRRGIASSATPHRRAL